MDRVRSRRAEENEENTIGGNRGRHGCTRFAYSRVILISLVFLCIVNAKGPQYDNRISCSSSFGTNIQSYCVTASPTRVSRQNLCLATTGLHRSRRALVKWTKHGYISFLVPGHDPPLEIAIYMDISRNPGSVSKPASTTTVQEEDTNLHTRNTSLPTPITYSRTHCPMCDGRVNRSRQSIQCCTCLDLFHQHCLNLNISSLNQSPKLDFSCHKCLQMANILNTSNGPHNLDEFKVPAKGLRFAHWNVNYMTKTKMEEIKLRVIHDDSKNLDILVITETCFSNKTNEDLFALPGYDLYRKDRATRSGGGVAIYVNTDLAVKRRADLEEPNLEILWLQVCPFKSKRPLLMAGVYRCPDAKVDYDRQLAENIERASLLNMKTILRGDLNLDYCRTQSFNRHRFVKDLKDSNFKQLVTEITRPASKTCLDHIWTNRPERITNIQCPNIYIFTYQFWECVCTNIVPLTKGSNTKALLTVTLKISITQNSLRTWRRPHGTLPSPLMMWRT